VNFSDERRGIPWNMDLSVSHSSSTSVKATRAARPLEPRLRQAPNYLSHEIVWWWRAWRPSPDLSSYRNQSAR
jgi:hypothetical protein